MQTRANQMESVWQAARYQLARRRSVTRVFPGFQHTIDLVECFLIGSVLPFFQSIDCFNANAGALCKFRLGKSRFVPGENELAGHGNSGVFNGRDVSVGVGLGKSEYGFIAFGLRHGQKIANCAGGDKAINPNFVTTDRGFLGIPERTDDLNDNSLTFRRNGIDGAELMNKDVPDAEKYRGLNGDESENSHRPPSVHGRF